MSGSSKHRILVAGVSTKATFKCVTASENSQPHRFSVSPTYPDEAWRPINQVITETLQCILSDPKTQNTATHTFKGYPAVTGTQHQLQTRPWGKGNQQDQCTVLRELRGHWRWWHTRRNYNWIHTMIIRITIIYWELSACLELFRFSFQILGDPMT